MSPPCRESDLDALLAGELSEEEAERVSAHATTCVTCARTLAWLRLERGWMAQRARRMPSRPALSFGALEARLRPSQAPHQGRWEHGGRMALGAVAAVAFMALSLVPQARPTSFDSEEPWGDGLVSVATVPACMDPSVEAVARVEARFGACLLASPARPLR
ncbi:zf-HC2 domain-containing protein [Archangium violaceum]|uniref:anti-sigma factor family protein n=1 Tax=Archangium violaceum TaxID=83451 RepID=UPI00193C5452|nr:zf-HC2 domain-containing protein [Archangium violaceum]QRK10632.1 zf-HC2 domain-containing protein [Archangium violaceum]